MLVEGESKKDMSQFYGKTDNFKTVVFPRNGEKPGDLVEVEVVNSTSHTLLGRRV